jgi:hypothetical protein
MANIIGEPLENYVIQQIKDRQEIQGTGVAGTDLSTSLRTPEVISILNSNTSWVKLASGVKIDPSKLSKTLTQIPPGKELAKKYVLFSGTSQLKNDKLSQRGGFNPSISDNLNSSYTYGDFGYSPMPGIISADVKTLNRGSIKKATVKIKVHNKQQFEIIDLLYLRLGYTVLLEWGNALYIEKSSDRTKFERKDVGNTLIENKFFISDDNSYGNYLNEIKRYRKKYNGNYDGLLAKVSNFSWTFNDDGSYDIDLTLISMGDIVESLKTNVSIDKATNAFITDQVKPLSTSDEQDIIDRNSNANSITSMLWLWKYFNQTPPPTKKIYIELAGGVGKKWIGKFLNKGELALSSVPTRWEFEYEEDPPITSTNIKKTEPLGSFEFDETNSDDIYEEVDNKLVEYANRKFPRINAKFFKSDITPLSSSERYISFINIVDNTQYFITARGLTTSTNITIKNPIGDAPNTAAFQLFTDEKQYYLRFNYLLEHIQNFSIPQINGKPLIKIDTNQWGSKMLFRENQISLDPRVCLVKNEDFKKYNDDGTSKGDSAKVFTGLTQWIVDTKKYAYPLNVYLNFKFIIESLNSASDERGDVNLFSFISNICDGLNKALGGINNLEPVIDEENNTLYIIDSSLTNQGKTSSEYSLKILGYKKQSNFYESNFIRGFDLKTAITPEYATIVTVGATAGGYVKGTEGTAFSKWNVGLVDRFKESITSPSTTTTTTTATTGPGIDEAEENYWKEIGNKITECYGFKGDLRLANESTTTPLIVSDNIIEKNISIGTEYLKYKLSTSLSNQSSIGFIPFKLGVKMDGISGIKIYQELNIDTSYLPPNYGESLKFIVTGVNHSLSNNDWVTEITTMAVPGTQNVVDELETEIIPTAPTIPTSDELDGIVGEKITLNEFKKRLLANSWLRDNLGEKGICALLGHLSQESSGGVRGTDIINAGSIEKTTRAFGIGQWLGIRRTNLLNFAKNTNKDPGKIDTQIEFIEKELKEKFKNVVTWVENTNNNLLQSTAIIHISYGLGNYQVDKSLPKIFIQNNYVNYNPYKITQVKDWEKIYEHFHKNIIGNPATLLLQKRYNAAYNAFNKKFSFD